MDWDFEGKSKTSVIMCRGCGRDLSLIEFHKMKDGLNNHCKDCINAQQRRWRAANKLKPGYGLNKKPQKKIPYNPNDYDPVKSRIRNRTWRNKEGNDQRIKEVWRKIEQQPWRRMSRKILRVIEEVLPGERETLTFLCGARPKQIYNYLVSNLPCGISPKDYDKTWSCKFLKDPKTFDLDYEKGRREAFHYTNIVPFFII